MIILDSHFHLNYWMRIITDELEVLIFEILNVLDFSLDVKSGKLSWFSL